MKWKGPVSFAAARENCAHHNEQTTIHTATGRRSRRRDFTTMWPSRSATTEGIPRVPPSIPRVGSEVAQNNPGAGYDHTTTYAVLDPKTPINPQSKLEAGTGKRGARGGGTGGGGGGAGCGHTHDAC